MHEENLPDERAADAELGDEHLDFGPPDVVGEVKSTYAFDRSRVVLAALSACAVIVVIGIFVFHLFKTVDAGITFGEGLGTRIDHGEHLRLYYSSQMDADEARRLVEFLVIAGLFAGKNRVDVYLDRQDGVVIVCFFGSWTNAEHLDSFRKLREDIALTVFHESAVEVHLCHSYIGAVAGKVQFSVVRKLTGKE